MNDTDMAAASAEATGAAAATALGQGQRMQQRQEWELAFLDAQRQQSPAASSYAPSHGAESGGARTPTAAAGERPSVVSEARGTPGQRASAAPPVAANPTPVTRAPAGAHNRIAPVVQSGGVVAIDPPPPNVPQRATVAARAAPPLPPPSRGHAPTPVAVQVHERDGEVQLNVRDAALSAGDARGFVARLRGLLQRLGLRLVSFTLNGGRIVEELPRPSGATGGDVRKTDLDLTI